VRSDGQLLGVLPLLARRRRGLWAAANDHTPQFGALAAGDAVARRLADALVERSCSVHLPCLDPHSPFAVALVDAAAGAGRRVVTASSARQPYVDLDGSWSDFELSLPRDVRRESARLRRRLGEVGRVSFDYEDGADRLPELLAEGFAIEGSGWKSERGTAIASCRATESFYRGLAEWAAERGWLRLAFLRVDGRPAAFDLCIEENGVIYVLKGGFDPAFRKYGPGVLLIRETLMHAFERGAVRYEFLGGEAPYKLAWTSAAHERVTVRTYSPTLAGAVAESARPLAARVLRAAGRRD
jgi:CelD/BcsL family acetyltransferase involved in cellulose biosynthesis